MKNKILHLMALDKFIPPFIKFIKENCEIDRHLFVFLHKERYDYGLTNEYPLI
ncbi:hypothetical protein [Nitrosophilus kaiyonis]|uniref:hypothetical protein n=1 Tax=Nitrosophilus kaiyonis TaxID=2930200 RepID=UPI002493AE41|nr:hypothetical protein [Nitrosophilus kaiyonis]